MTPQRPPVQAWLDIPLADYEGHMSAVGQAPMLAEQLAALLADHAPRSVAVIGCAGGNGFDRIAPAMTRRVVGVDVNPRYVEELSRRYAERMPGLELYVADVQQGEPGFEPVDLVYAALLLEYVELEPTFQSLGSMCRPGGILALVLQLPSRSEGVVSASPFTSLDALAPLMRLVAPATAEARAAGAGFELRSLRRLALPSGKEFVVQEFRKGVAQR